MRYGWLFFFILITATAVAEDDKLAFMEIDALARCTDQWRHLAEDVEDVRQTAQLSGCMVLLAREREMALRAWENAAEPVRDDCAGDVLDRDVSLRSYRALRSCLQRKTIERGASCLPHLIGCRP